MNQAVEKRQLWYWMMASMAAPLAAVMGGQPWLPVGMAAAVCMALCWTMHRQIRENAVWPRWFYMAQWLWTAMVLGRLLFILPEAWPQTQHPNLIVMILLLAALWAVRGGTGTCARMGTVLFWFVCVLMVLTLAAALKDLRAENLKPDFHISDTAIFVILLIPCAGVLLPRRERTGAVVPIIVIGLFAFAVTVLISGALSPDLAEKIENPFYELSRTVSFGSAAQRFEALVSAGLTVSWFLLLCLLLSVSAEMIRGYKPAWSRIGAPVCSVVSYLIYLCEMQMNDTVLAFCGALFWGLLPILAQGMGDRKNM